MINNTGIKVFLAAVGPAVLGALGILYLKRAGESLRNELSSTNDALHWISGLASSTNLWVGIGCYGLAFLWLMLVIGHVRISQFYPIAVGLNIALTTLAGVMILNEPLHLTRLIGLILILAGVALVSR